MNPANTAAVVAQQTLPTSDYPVPILRASPLLRHTDTELPPVTLACHTAPPASNSTAAAVRARTRRPPPPTKKTHTRRKKKREKRNINLPTQSIPNLPLSLSATTAPASPSPARRPTPYHHTTPPRFSVPHTPVQFAVRRRRHFHPRWLRPIPIFFFFFSFFFERFFTNTSLKECFQNLNP